MRLRTYLCPSRNPFGLLVLTLVVVVADANRASAATLTVCRSGCTFADFQVALDAAQLGDTILLKAGETFVGNFVLPDKAGASGASILIRSDAPDSALPPPETRLVPYGYAGGNTDRASLARLTGKGGIWKTTPILQTEPRAHHYRLQFLEIDGVSQEGWETLVELGTNTAEQATLDSVPSAIVLDRVFIHGHPIKMQKRCVALNGRDLDVRNSYIVGCASFALDAQAIAGFNAPGPLRIINNYLEASTENVMFGGADPRIAGLVPSDIEIRRNHFSKPTAWRDPILAPPSAAPSASVAPGGGILPPGMQYFTVVAVLEIATDIALSAQSEQTAASIASANSAVVLRWNAVPGADRYRVYIGSAPQAQNRYVETPDADTLFIYRGGGEIGGSPPSAGTRWNVKNLLELKNAQRVLIDGNVFEHIWSASQVGYAIVLTPRNEDGAAPWSLVRDITFTNNILRHAAGGINILGEDDIRGSARTGRITIRNNLVYDVSYAWGGASHFLLMTRSPFDVKVDHNTVFHDALLVLIDDGASSGFAFTNNVAPHNSYGIFGSGAGMGSSALAAYFPDAVVTHNALGGGPASLYPPQNFFPDMATFTAQFQNIAAADFRLVAASIFRGAGTDGKDLGVDFAALNAAQASPSGGTGDTGGGASGGGGSSGGPVPPPSGPLALPGTIQVEDFDEGGAGIAYADTTPGNSGGQYRSTDVDIEPTAAPGGYNVGWGFAGEWLRYTVTVAAAGTYDLEARVASQNAGGTFHIEVDGVDKTGSLTIPNTGGWQTWTTIRASGITLGAGQQVWRLVLDTNGATGAVGNFDDIRVTASSSGGTAASTPFGGTPAALPGTLQAENFDDGGEGVAYHDLSAANDGAEYRGTAVDIETTLDAGGGHNVGWMFAGEWLKYTVTVGAAGTYDIDMRVASDGAGGTFHIEVNGADKTGPMTIPNTGGWQTWTTIQRTGVSLGAGQQVWRIVMDTNGATGAVGNINAIGVLTAAPAQGSGGSGDIVLYSSDVTTVSGNWARLGSTTGAGGAKMQSADLGWSNTSQPLAAPGDYFEARFVPEANRAYRVWLRLRAGGDSKYNDSVWVQFSDAVNGAGTPLWRTGTPTALLVNLEACSGCGVSGWGWQNGAWWLPDEAIVQFTTSTPQTIRIQTREDGIDIDQIVLSPVTYFNAAPGSLSRDATIVAKPQ